MIHRRLSALVPRTCSLVVPAVAGMFVAAGLAATAVQAQQAPPATPQTTPPRPAAPAARAPARPPAKPAPAAQAPAAPLAAQPTAMPAQPAMPQLIYSPWAKFCGKGNDPSAKEVCFTGKDARTEAGQPVVAAALIEPEGEPKKLFRVTLPSPLHLQYGTRLIIDNDPPMSAPFFTCFANGCMVDFEATPELIGKLKKSQMLTIQAINIQAAPIQFQLPLIDTSGNSFAKANEGPPTDPKVFEEQQKKLQEELQKRADEARKRLETQGATASAPK
jgi:invasion protein IalB